MNICRICGYRGEFKKYNVEEMMYKTGESFTYIHCPVCDCLQIKDVPANLGEYYKDNYYSFDERDGAKCDAKKQEVQYRILDVGCGSGDFLCALAKQGMTELYGCDPFVAKDIEYENGVKIYKKNIHEMQGEYDVIFMNDSFEHVTDPHEVMESAYRLLSGAGVLRIDIPVFPNIAFEMFGTYWYQLDAPRHIFLHSEKSMHYLADKHGFYIREATWDSNNSQIVRSFLYSKGIPFVEQTQEIFEEFFTEEEMNELQRNSEFANDNKVGDHALFVLAKK